MKFVSAIFSMLAVVACTVSCVAQTSEEIQSDRPGMSYSPSTVGARTIQFQFGGLYYHRTISEWEQVISLAQPEGHIRVGLLERFELGFWGAYDRSTTKTRNKTSSNEQFNFSIQARTNILKADGYIPSVGMLVEIVFPEYSRVDYTDNIYPRAFLLIDQKLHKRVSLTSNIGMSHQAKARLLYTLNLGVNVSSRVKFFAEHAGWYSSGYSYSLPFDPTSPRTKSHSWFAFINGGGAVLITNDLQLDLQAGYGFIPDSPAFFKDWNIGAGISWRVRIPKRKKVEAAPTAP